MKQRWRRITTVLAGLNRREQVLLCGTVVVLLVVLLNVLAIQPYEARREVQQRQRDALRAEIAELETGLGRLRGVVDDAAGRERQARRRQLERSLEALEHELLQRTATFVAPSDMAALLRDVLSVQAGVTLLRLENIRPERVGEMDGPVVFRHGLELELRADYLSTLRFLETLERLPWRLLWDELEYRLESHPEARVNVRLSTLSAHEEWIGV